MRAVDIYALTRDIPEDLRGQFEKNLSKRDAKLRVKTQEFAQIRAIVEELRAISADRECYEDWFYSFTIPHISREFDLLKVGKNQCVVNLELKSASPSVTMPRMQKQLQRNAYYLSLIGRRIHSFTYLGDGQGKGALYTLKNGKLKKCSFQELADKLKRIKEPVRDRIEEMFHPGEYLISPFSEPERFCAGQYFLTEHQQQMKARIVSGIRRSRALLWGITGEAGTGKTLLLYDIVKELSTGYSVGVVHCGNLSEGHQKLREMLEGVAIFEADALGSESEKTDAVEKSISKYDIICVDETQRLKQEQLRRILRAYEMGRIKACIFVYDLKQVLSRSELEQNNPLWLRTLKGFTELSLTKNIRTSKEIYAFINVMMDLKKRSHYDSKGIDLLWAGSRMETECLLEKYRQRGYQFISLPPYADENQVESAGGLGTTRVEVSHDVIGLEFDSVAVVLDRRFSYDQQGILIGAHEPGVDYLYVQMLYQNVSRAKEKLCVIVQENEEVFRELVRVLE